MSHYSSSMWRLGASLVLVVGLLLAACGGPSANVSVQLSANAVSTLLGGSEAVTVTLTRSAAATATVALDATGGPEWVSVTFSPTVLAGANLVSTVTISTDAQHPAAAPGTFTLTVSAVGEGLSAQDTLELEVDLLDVNGTVVDALSEPVAGATVLVPGQPSVTTAADGSFSFTGLSVPYDLTVVNTLNSVGHQFLALTTAEPRINTIDALLNELGGQLEAVVTGDLIHPTLVPLPADHAAIVCIEGINGLATGCDNISLVGATSYDLTASWSLPVELNARVRAYIFEVDADGVPVAIKATGTVGPTNLVDGDAALLNITLADTATQASMPVTTTVPAGYTLQSRGLLSHYSDFASISLPSLSTADPTDTVIAPFFAGAELSTFATAASNAAGSASVTVAWSTGHVSGEATTLNLAAPPTAVSPPDGATDVSLETEFTAANPAGGVITFVVQPAGSGPVFAVTTANASANIPDLAALGMGLPSGASYSWLALASPHLTSTDDAVTGDGYFGGYLSLTVATLGGGLSPMSDGQISTSDALAFTTQ